MHIHTRVVAGASTGVAAILINGQTIHTLLQFDTQHKGFFSIKPLAEPKRQALYNFYKYVFQKIFHGKRNFASFDNQYPRSQVTSFSNHSGYS